MTNSKYLFLNMYDELYGDIQFLCNSEVRIKLLKSLDESPKTMRELNDLVLLSYSSISNNLNKLMSIGFLTKSERKFYLTNMAYLNLINCLDFNNSIKVADSFDNFLKTHDIGPLCDDSLKNLSSLIGARLVESVSVDIYKPHNEFKSLVESSDSLKVIFPFLHPDYPKIVKNLLIKGVNIDLLINKDILPIFIENVGVDLLKESIDNGKLSLKYLTKELRLSLAVSNSFISMGLFKSDGSFDQNRLIISQEEESILWGNLLFEKHNDEALFVKIDDRGL